MKGWIKVSIGLAAWAAAGFFLLHMPEPTAPKPGPTALPKHVTEW